MAVALGLWPVAGSAGDVTPVARKKPLPPTLLQVLTAEEAAVYDAWCDQLAPGAGDAGVSRYLDAQLAAPRDDAKLFLRVLANPPFEDFYRAGIAGIEQETRARFGGDATFTALDDTRQRTVIEAAASDSAVAWKTPPPGFFFSRRGHRLRHRGGLSASGRSLPRSYPAALTVVSRRASPR